MNEYMFYTYEGHTLSPKDGCDVENCQILGRAKGETSQEARQNLLRECPWLEEYGYNVNVADCRQILTDENRKDIKKIVQYLIGAGCQNMNESCKSQEEIHIIDKRLKDLCM